jgi:hypothetical protein
MASWFAINLRLLIVEGSKMGSDFEIFVVLFLAISAVSLGVIAKGVFAIRDAIVGQRNAPTKT